MPNRPEEDKPRIAEIRDKLNQVEVALRACLWMPRHQKDDVLKGMSWVRDHINRGRSDPSIETLYYNIFDKKGVDYMGVDDMIRELEKNSPSYHSYRDELSKQLKDITGGNWADYIPNYHMTTRPLNYSLPVSHPDKTDEYGFPYYIPTDKNGIPQAGFDLEGLCQTGVASNARSMYGMLGLYEAGKDNRFKLPVITEASMEQHLEEIKKLNKDKEEAPEYLEERLKKWYIDVYVEETIAEIEKNLKATHKQLKQLFKDGEIREEESKLDVKAELNRRKAEMLRKANSLTTLRDFMPMYLDREEIKRKQDKADPEVMTSRLDSLKRKKDTTTEEEPEEQEEEVIP